MTSWDSEKLWLKAKLFIDCANEQDQSSPEIAFWTALSLECLARSALTFVHPALNADPREDTNVLYGFGYNLTAKPRSLPARHTSSTELRQACMSYIPEHYTEYNNM